MSVFSLEILAAEKTVYNGDCLSLRFPATDGLYGVLPNHENSIMAVVPGTLSYTDGEGTEHLCVVSNGLVKIEENTVLVLVETAEAPEDIDRNRAERDAEEAREALILKKSLQERRSAEFKLARALSRMRAKDNVNND